MHRVLCVSVAALAAAVGPASPAAAESSGRAGDLVASRLLTTVPARQARLQLGALGLPTIGLTAAARIYRVQYRTPDASGRLSVASGLVAVPEGGHRRRPHIVEYLHGTVAGDNQAPSRFGADEGAPVATLIASGGAVAALPDYLGLGDSRGPHPYLQADLEASASADMLRATRTLANRRGVRLDPRLVVTGFSEGGQAAMAVAQLLTARPITGLRLAAVAPVAGPYDLSQTTWPALFDGSSINDRSGPFYAAYLLSAYQRRYGVLDQQGDVFRAPYAARVPHLFTGRLTSAQAARRLPTSPRRLLTPAFVAAQRVPTGALLNALQTNDTCEFRPAVPVRLYYGSRDTDVPPANADVCRARIEARGGQASIVDVGAVDHRASIIAALPRLLSWSTAVLRRR